MKEYVHENKTALPSDFVAFNEEEDDALMSPPPAKRAKKAANPSTPSTKRGSATSAGMAAAASNSMESTASSIVPILAAVAAQQLEQQVGDGPLAPVIAAPDMSSSVSFIRGTPLVRIFETVDRSYVVQVFKPAQTTLQLFGPDARGSYKISGTYAFMSIPQEEQVLFSNSPSGDFEVEIRVPPTHETPLRDHLTFEDSNGVVSIYFRPKISAAPLTDLK
jgi:hypothetical protein